MRKPCPNRIFLATALILLVGPAMAAVAPEQWLLEQVRAGEASHQDVLVQQSLYRLESIDPDNLEAIAARQRLALRQGNQPLALQQLARLRRMAPNSAITQRAQLNMDLTTAQTQRQLQQVRLLATAGRLAEAKAGYDEMFHGQPPTLDLAVEYWRLVARLPGQAQTSMDRLQALDRQYPGNTALRLLMANLLFGQRRDAEGYGVLRQLASDPAGRGQAGEIWLSNIKALPPGRDSLARLREFIAFFADGPDVATAREELARQEKLLADPRYQARTAGLAAVDHGEGVSAIAPLRQALVLAPEDPQVLGALGLAYVRAGRRQQALSLFERAQAVDQNGFHGDKWRSLIASTRYWLLLNQADEALSAHNLPLARQRYLQAQRIQRSGGEARVGLGDVALAGSDYVAGETYYQRALRLDPDSGAAIRGLTTIYQRQSPQKALDFLTRLGPRQQIKMHPRMVNLRADLLGDQADEYAAHRQWPLAVASYRQVLRLAPERIWPAYHLAQALRAEGRFNEADSVFPPLLQQRPDDAEVGYAYALYLSSSGRPAQALAYMHRLPLAAASGQWGNNLNALTARLQWQAKQDQAVRLRDGGDEPAAIALLSTPPVNDGSALLLADWALARGDYHQALEGYQRISRHEPDNRDARLGIIESLAAGGQVNDAKRLLARLPPDRANPQDSLNTRRRIAMLWNGLGEPEHSLALLRDLHPIAAASDDAQTNALIFRDSARLERRLALPDAALKDNRRAMVASGIAAAPPLSHDDYTRLTRSQANDDWLKRGIRDDGADLARQQDPVVTLDHDYWSSSGTGGISNLHAHDTMLQVDMPWQDGRFFFRTDTVQMSAGRFATANGVHHQGFGTCASVGCDEDLRQTASGTGLATGWRNDRWQGDIGTTPLGFDVVDWIGGVSYSGDWQHIGWSATASRRPISSSLLAFAGTRDPATGITWGGVRATGVNLSASYDRGEANGVWSNLGVQQLTGKNVEDNQRARLMAGYYHKLVNEQQRRVTLGLSSMWWHYQKNLSGYSLGQGGYYSPQHYLSFAVPVNYRQRTDNWSWQLGGSLGWSQSSTSARRRYPLPSLIPDDVTDKNVVEQGGASTGFGYTALALIERRLSSHWTMGAGIDIQQAKDYTPSHALIYLRYSVAGWQGDLDSPPQPLTPYADFK